MRDEEKSGDHTHLVGLLPDGSALVERYKNGKVETGIVRQIQEGKPIAPGDEYVKIVPDDGCYRCESVYKAPEVGHGPAKVTSDDYRSGWDAIWSKGSQAVN